MSDPVKLQRRRKKTAEVPPRRPESVPSTGPGVHTGADLPKGPAAPPAVRTRVGPPRPRLTEEEEELVWPVRKLVRELHGQGELLRWLVKREGLTKARARAVWDACMADLVEEWDVSRPELLTRLLAQTATIASAAATAGNHSVALSAIAQIARLTKIG